MHICLHMCVLGVCVYIYIFICIYAQAHVCVGMDICKENKKKYVFLHTYTTVLCTSGCKYLYIDIDINCKSKAQIKLNILAYSGLMTSTAVNFVN